MTLDAFKPVYPQSIDHDVNGNLRCTDELGCGPRSGIDLLTLASLEFTKVYLAELIDHKRGCTEPHPEIACEASLKGWETAEWWITVANQRTSKEKP